MHIWLASITTPTPRGSMASSMANAICLVRRSWTCNRRAKVSAILANFDRPKTWPFLAGIYPIATWTHHHLRSATCHSSGIKESAHLASERDEMVFAEREDVNVSYNDHLIVVFGEHSTSDNVCSG